ncbi:Regulator of chromosome condensation family protein [Coccidioides posadasii C735 delta SOWgp]|uniref:Regulator of chromosome condensation family protein n=1 Tax=Coccidioides posadasii (strain C735) TaxID=222929 RepID=C5P3N7_COCP7|nr:Regulator of chromosome condensation family protein [Coccidioides posadasii C735 delta SOWgp]EER28305.1 Regulator of chromosome condensation family protein [Coccidioides posadasii C735 delta SOWgp]|eukprot:XP_003070450.1 Regulator of chromosome condensation family protein [Coccidioides posadasii C735 delta SOWgp]
MAPRKAAATRSSTRIKSAPTTTTAIAPKKAGVKKATAVPTATKKQKASAAALKSTKAASTKATAAKDTTTKAPRKAKADEAPVSKKRKVVSEDETEPRPKKARAAKEEAPKPKRTRVTASPAVKPPKPKVVINEAPTEKLNIYVFGEGSSGELGLGTAKNAVDVKRPRLNPLLLADKIGVVQIATGGMHCVALTHDNKIYTWGVNDQGALGRDTTWEGKLKDIDDAGSDSDSDDGSDSGMNPKEATPTPIPADYFPEGTIFVEVAAGDSSSFALTDDGFVYGWGTFRGNEGILGFDATTRVQTTPKLIPSLKKIKHIACGDNHALALDTKGAVFAWGSGQQNQLGRRIVERTKLNGLHPREFGLPKNITYIDCGSFHSFAIHQTGKVYSWGLNSYGETGIPQGAGSDEAVILHPEVVKSLKDKNVIQLCGGSHHSLAVTKDGECLVWGRVDGFQTGLDIKSLPDDAVIKDDRDRARILSVPTAVPGIDAKFVAAGADHSIAIAKDGRAWTWGFSANYQTGQGTDDDIEVATVVDNTAVRGKMLNWAGAGGQYSVLAGPAVTVNGVAANADAPNGNVQGAN